MTPFHNFPKNIIAIFTGRNLLFHLLAIALTFLIVATGLDWQYFLFVRDIPLRSFLSYATGLGMIVPIFGILLLFLFAKIKKNKDLVTVSFLLWQSAFLGWLISSTYKAFTGRVQPPHGVFDPAIDLSHSFHFGFLEHGIFWGWPSSHTTVAFAMSFAVIFFFQKKKLAIFLALLYALYIGLGISMQIHWLSEFVAGALIGAAIGAVTGKSFRK